MSHHVSSLDGSANGRPLFHFDAKGRVLSRSVLARVLIAAALFLLVVVGARIPSSTLPGVASARAAADGAEGRVLLEDQTTSASQTFQNPDGTLTTELDSGPVRFEKPNGDWVDIDNTLVERGGQWVPKASPLDISFSAGGDGAFVEIARVGGDSVALGWPSDLPTPIVEGATLTYPDAVPGGDLVVTALSTGFTHSVVLYERPDLGMGLEIPIPINLEGTKVTQAADGGLKISSPDDGPLRAPAPRMWDADLGSDGLPSATEPVEVSLEHTKLATTMTLEPAAEFLNDPATTYPVTIDPTYTTVDPTDNGDTFINNGSYTAGTDTWGWDTLRSGTQNSGTTVARSYLDFPTLDLAGKTLVSATLQARVVGSLSCTNGTTVAYRITSPWHLTTSTTDPNRLTWANQPSIDSSYAPQYWLPHGGPAGSACAAHGWATWNVLPSVTAWKAGGTATQLGFRLQAATPTANGSFREFRSVNGTTGVDTYYPRLIVTYNSYPDTPTNVTMTPGADGVIGSVTPTISANVTDPDGGDVKARFNIYSGSTMIWYGDGSTVASGGVSELTVPEGVLTNGAQYTLKAYGNDGSLYSGANATAGGYVPIPFGVDTALIPDDPDPAAPMMTTYGVDEYQLADLQAIATSEDITVQQAVDRYGWQPAFADAAEAAAALSPETFAYADAGTGPNPEPEIVFTDEVPVGAADLVEDLPVAVDLEDGAPYSADELDALAYNATDAILDTVGDGSTVVSTANPVTGTVSAAVNMVGSTRPTVTAMRSAALTSIEEEQPNIDVPGVEVTVVDDPVGTDDTLRGGHEISSSTHTCTSGFPVKEDSTNKWGLLTARHCDNDSTWYGSVKGALKNASMFLDWKYGDIQYHRSTGEQVGKSFYYSPTNYRTIQGIKKPVIDMKVCLYGQTSKGTIDNTLMSTCSHIKNLGQSKGTKVGGEKVTIGGLVETYDYVSEGGDSGGPWYIGGYAVGINQGSMGCGFLWNSSCGVFTPIKGNEGRGSFNVHLWH